MSRDARLLIRTRAVRSAPYRYFCTPLRRMRARTRGFSSKQAQIGNGHRRVRFCHWWHSPRNVSVTTALQRPRRSNASSTNTSEVDHLEERTVTHNQTFVTGLVRSMSRRSAIVVVAAAAALSTGASASAQDDKQPPKDTIVFTIDVAEDFALFNPTFVRATDTQPERGSFFVTEGNIFPGGTIQGDGANFDPNSDGALGRWFCRGTHLVSATEFLTSARAVHTGQLYLFPDESRSITTEGVEGNIPLLRAIT